MQTTDSGTPQILDFNSFKQQREQVQTPQQQAIPDGFTPTLMWYPVWVLVPTPPQTPANPS